MPKSFFYLLNNVGVLNALQEGNFADSCGGDTVVLLLKSDLLECDKVTSDEVLALVDHTVGTFSEFLETLVTLKLLGVVAELLLCAIFCLCSIELLVAGWVLIFHYFE